MPLRNVSFSGSVSIILLKFLNKHKNDIILVHFILQIRKKEKFTNWEKNSLFSLQNLYLQYLLRLRRQTYFKWTPIYIHIDIDVFF